MASGGMYDHLGGGFARYSVDAFWMVPHFEKMLYDQALLARVYLHAWQVTGEARFRQVLDEIVTYVLRDLHHGDGGLYSAEDADSEGEEGIFYVWRPEAIRDVLGDAAEVAIEWYGVTPQGNFEGSNILHRPVRGDLLRPPEVEAAREALFQAREQRVRPGLDDKVLTEWNALMIATLAEAGAAADEPAWVAAATQCAEFLLTSLRDADGTWMRSWQAGRAATAPPPPAIGPTPSTTPPWSTPSPAWRRPRARPAGSPRPGPWPTRCSSCSGIPTRAVCSPRARAPTP